MPGRRAPLSERLWRRVVKTDTCWLWTGCRSKQGYGSIGDEGGQPEGAHRVAYRITYGPIPAGLCVLHRCDNPPCCNPAHLFLGTNTDNVADREAKGRQLYRKPGEANGRAKLTAEQVKTIHADTRKQDDIAAAYGISQSTVHRIKARTAGGWNHLALPSKRTFRRRSEMVYGPADMARLGEDPTP